MKKRIIFLILLVWLMPISFAKEVEIPAVRVEEEGLREGIETGATYYAVSGDAIVASVGGGEVEYYHKDRLGSNIFGEGRSKTLPFGQEILNPDHKFTFTGKEEDSSGLYYFGARYYDSDLGRFVSVDPVMDNHPYVYTMNNPLRFVDPTGKNWEVGHSRRQNPEEFPSDRQYATTATPEDIKRLETFRYALAGSLVALSAPAAYSGMAAGWGYAGALATPGYLKIASGAGTGWSILRGVLGIPRNLPASDSPAIGRGLTEETQAELGESIRSFYSVKTRGAAQRILEGGQWTTSSRSAVSGPSTILGEGGYFWGTQGEAEAYLSHRATSLIESGVIESQGELTIVRISFPTSLLENWGQHEITTTAQWELAESGALQNIPWLARMTGMEMVEHRFTQEAISQGAVEVLSGF